MTQRLSRLLTSPGLQIEGVLAYFMHLKCQKRNRYDVDTFFLGGENYPPPPRYVLSTLYCKNMTPNALKCILCILLP
jgi:hypothetical protein